MDCGKCQALLSAHLDDELRGEERRSLDRHIAGCPACANAHGDLDRITRLAGGGEELYAPSDSQALWMRIRESVEADVTWARDARLAPAAAGGWWSRLWQSRWEFTAPQVAGAFAALAVAAVLTATVGTNALRQTGVSVEAPAPTIGAQRANGFAPVAFSDYDGYVRRRQADMDYLRQRVEQNKNRLPPRMRESFERTMGRLDQDVSLSLDQLRQNPHDDVSEQMLNQALQDKVEILREISSEF